MPYSPGTDLGSLSGKITADGSSTVFPIMEALAEEFGKQASGVEITVDVSGTGGGFKRFCAGETDFSDASRAIKDEEAATCAAEGVSYYKFEIAYDGISVVVNPENDWVSCLTVAQLNQIWAKDSAVKKWSDIDPSWPSDDIALYGPGTDSGTYDYFTQQINGEEGVSREDYTPSEDDNVLVEGVAGDKNALGFFGYSLLRGEPGSLKLSRSMMATAASLPARDRAEPDLRAALPPTLSLCECGEPGSAGGAGVPALLHR